MTILVPEVMIVLLGRGVKQFDTVQGCRPRRDSRADSGIYYQPFLGLRPRLQPVGLDYQLPFADGSSWLQGKEAGLPQPVDCGTESEYIRRPLSTLLPHDRLLPGLFG